MGRVQNRRGEAVKGRDSRLKQKQGRREKNASRRERKLIPFFLFLFMMSAADI